MDWRYTGSEKETTSWISLATKTERKKNWGGTPCPVATADHKISNCWLSTFTMLIASAMEQIAVFIWGEWDKERLTRIATKRSTQVDPPTLSLLLNLLLCKL